MQIWLVFSPSAMKFGKSFIHTVINSTLYTDLPEVKHFPFVCTSIKYISSNLNPPKVKNGEN